MFTNVIKLVVIVFLPLWVTVRIPSILTLTDQSPVIILYAIVAPERAIASKALANVALRPCAHPSDLEHTLIACVELVAKHRLHVVFQCHATVFEG